MYVYTHYRIVEIHVNGVLLCVQGHSPMHLKFRGHVAKSRARGPCLSDVSGRLRLKVTGRKTGSLCFRQ